MKEFIEFIAKKLVNKPEAVRVEETIDGNEVNFILYVDDTETGKVIGKEGKTAKSIRTLIKAVAAKNGFMASLNIPDRMVSAGSIAKDSNVKES